jgi:hypothetical protein
MKEETKYHDIGGKIKGAEESQMFGKPCYKVKGKAFMCFFEKCLVVKLSGDAHKEALSLDGAELFDPGKKGRAMKEWVQIPYNYSAKWEKFAKAAFDYIKKADLF